MYVPGAVCSSVELTVWQVEAQRFRVTWLVDNTTGVPSAYRTVMTPENRLGAPKAGLPVVPRIGNPITLNSGCPGA